MWDEKAGRYINKEASEEQAAALKPPPIFLPNAPTAASSQDSTQPSTSGLVDQPGSLPSLPGMSVPPTGNRFSLKSNYFLLLVLLSYIILKGVRFFKKF